MSFYGPRSADWLPVFLKFYRAIHPVPAAGLFPGGLADAGDGEDGNDFDLACCPGHCREPAGYAVGLTAGGNCDLAPLVTHVLPLECYSAEIDLLEVRQAINPRCSVPPVEVRTIRVLMRRNSPGRFLENIQVNLNGNTLAFPLGISPTGGICLMGEVV